MAMVGVVPVTMYCPPVLSGPTPITLYVVLVPRLITSPPVPVKLIVDVPASNVRLVAPDRLQMVLPLPLATVHVPLPMCSVLVPEPVDVREPMVTAGLMALKSSTQVLVQALNVMPPAEPKFSEPEPDGQLAVAAPQTVIVHGPGLHEAASNVAISALFFGMPPVAAQAPPVPPVEANQFAVFVLSQFPFPVLNQKQVAAFAESGRNIQNSIARKTVLNVFIASPSRLNPLPVPSSR